MAREPLRRYYAILAGEETARYLKAKGTRVSVDLSSAEERLWKAHESGLLDMEGEGKCDGSHSLLDLKAELADRIFRRCILCERRCEARRDTGDKGHCGVLEPRISADFIHMGEEPDLVPSYTVFFTGCTFNCVYCQNWDISTRPQAGQKVSPEEIAARIEARTTECPESGRFVVLGKAARNVNWVGGDPTSNIPFILKVLKISRANIPQIWNSNMYLSEESMKLLNGVIDVYLTDLKYGNDLCASRLSNVPHYMRIVTRNHLLARDQCEMIIRHLVLPNHVQCCTRPVLEWIAENLDNVKVNVMAQYRPEHKARRFEDIARGLKASEFEDALDIADDLGLDVY